MKKFILYLCYLICISTRGHGGGHGGHGGHGHGRGRGRGGKAAKKSNPVVYFMHRGSISTRRILPRNPCEENGEVEGATCLDVQKGIFVENIINSENYVDLAIETSECERKETYEDCKDYNYMCYQENIKYDIVDTQNQTKDIEWLHNALVNESKSFQKKIYNCFDIKEDLNQPCTCVTLHDSKSNCGIISHYDELQQSLQFDQNKYNDQNYENLTEIILKDMFDVLVKYLSDVSKWEHINTRDLRLIVFKYRNESTYTPRYNDMALELSIRNAMIEHLKNLSNILDSYNVPVIYQDMMTRKNKIINFINNRRIDITKFTLRIYECYFKHHIDVLSQERIKGTNITFPSSLENVDDNLDEILANRNVPLNHNENYLDNNHKSVSHSNNENNTDFSNMNADYNNTSLVNIDLDTEQVKLIYGTKYGFYPYKKLPDDICKPKEPRSLELYLNWLVPIILYGAFVLIIVFRKTSI